MTKENGPIEEEVYLLSLAGKLTGLRGVSEALQKLRLEGPVEESQIRDVLVNQRKGYTEVGGFEKKVEVVDEILPNLSRIAEIIGVDKFLEAAGVKTQTPERKGFLGMRRGKR